MKLRDFGKERADFASYVMEESLKIFVITNSSTKQTLISCKHLRRSSEKERIRSEKNRAKEKLEARRSRGKR